MSRIQIILSSLFISLLLSLPAQAYVNISYSNYGYGWNWGLSYGSGYGYYTPTFFRTPILSDFRVYRANVELMALLRDQAEAQRLRWLNAKQTGESRVAPEILEPLPEILPLDVPPLMPAEKVAE